MMRHTINATRASFTTGETEAPQNDNQGGYVWHGKADSLDNPQPESVNQSSSPDGTEPPINGRWWLAAMLAGLALWLAIAWLAGWL